MSRTQNDVKNENKTFESYQDPIKKNKGGGRSIQEVKTRKTQLSEEKPRKDARKRVLYFEELQDTALVEQTEKHIEELKKDIQGKKLISLQKWCDDSGIDLNVMIRLLFDSDFPVIRIGSFQGAYQDHIDQAIGKETERQLEQQLKNRVCAKILAERQHEARRQTRKNKTTEISNTED